MKNKEYYKTLEELEDELIGKIGTDERDQYELEKTYGLIGEVIRSTRRSKKLTQSELGKLIGVQKARMSKIESGSNITLDTLIKIFKALKVPVKLVVVDGVEIPIC